MCIEAGSHCCCCIAQALTSMYWKYVIQWLYLSDERSMALNFTEMMYSWEKNLLLHSAAQFVTDRQLIAAHYLRRFLGGDESSVNFLEIIPPGCVERTRFRSIEVWLLWLPLTLLGALQLLLPSSCSAVAGAELVFIWIAIGNGQKGCSSSVKNSSCGCTMLKVLIDLKVVVFERFADAILE